MKRGWPQCKERFVQRRKYAEYNGRGWLGVRGTYRKEPGIRDRANRAMLVLDFAAGNIRRLLIDRFFDTGCGADLGLESAASGLGAEKGRQQYLYEQHQQRCPCCTS